LRWSQRSRKHLHGLLSYDRISVALFIHSDSIMHPTSPPPSNARVAHAPLQNTQFSRAFEAYGKRYGLELGQLLFEFDGDELSAKDTPEGVGMDAVEGETNKFAVDVLER
jgi:hypothetical protein